jgi:hypothetical protein
VVSPKNNRRLNQRKNGRSSPDTGCDFPLVQMEITPGVICL